MAKLNYCYILRLNIFQKIFYTLNKQLLTDYLTRKRKSISIKKKFENVVRFHMILFSSFEIFTLRKHHFQLFWFSYNIYSDFIFWWLKWYNINISNLLTHVLLKQPNVLKFLERLCEIDNKTIGLYLGYFITNR